jgi:hypothetical protein
MSVIPNYQPVDRRSMDELPDWVEQYMEPVHKQVKALTEMAQSEVTINDNLRAEVRDFKGVTSGTAFNVTINKFKRIAGAIWIQKEDEVEVVDEITVSVKPDFTGDGTLVIWGK